MNKAVLYVGLGLGVGAIAYLLYRSMQNPSQTYSTTSYNPNSNPSIGNQAGYPFQPAVPARVDNSNQPWAANNRDVLNGASTPQILVDLQNANQFLSSAVGIGQSLTSIWQDFGIGDWFSSGSDDMFMSDVSYDMDWSYA